MGMSDDEESATLCTRSRAVSYTTQNEQRGQIEVRSILSVFVLVIIGGALVAAAIDMQSSLASMSGGSWFWATMLTLSIVAVMVAAALGLE